MHIGRLSAFTIPIATGLALALCSAAPALAQGPARQTASVLFSTQLPGTGSGLHISIDYRNPTDPQAKPYAVQRILTSLDPGSRIDTSVPARCDLSDADLMANGARGCPAASIVGSGMVTLSSLNSTPSTTAAVTLVNNTDELIFVIEAASTPARMIIRSPIRGATITNDIPRLPGGPPDGATAVRTADLTINPVSRRDGRQLRNYITTPAVCPASNHFSNSATLTYFDGITQTVPSPAPCLDTARPAIRLRGFRRRGCVRHSVKARIRVTDTSSLRSVIVRLNRRKVKTTRRKVFTVKLRHAKFRRGRNVVTVVATDRRGNRSKVTHRFVGCRVSSTGNDEPG